MKEFDLEVPRPVTAAQAARVEFEFGQVIPMEWLLNQFGIELPETGTRAEFQAMQFKFMEYMQHFQDEMLFTYKIALRNSRGRGYELVHPEEQTAFALDRLKKEVDRELRKAGNVISNIRHDLLNSEQRRQTADAAGKLAAINAFVGHNARLTKQ